LQHPRLVGDVPVKGGSGGSFSYGFHIRLTGTALTVTRLQRKVASGTCNRIRPGNASNAFDRSQGGYLHGKAEPKRQLSTYLRMPDPAQCVQVEHSTISSPLGNMPESVSMPSRSGTANGKPAKDHVFGKKAEFRIAI